MPFTLAQARLDRGFQAVCNCDPSAPVAPATVDPFRDLLNQATRQAMELGDWWLTVAKANLFFYGNDVVWPRWVGTPLALKVCREPVQMTGQWYDMLPWGRDDYTCDLCDQSIAVNDGVTPVWQNVPPGMGVEIRAYALNGNDGGRKIRIYGIDGNGDVIRELPAGVEGRDITLVAGAPGYAVPQLTVRRITRVQKEVTIGPVRLVQYDPVSTAVMDMALYDPGETEPCYRHTTLPGNCSCACSCSSTTTPNCAVILAKVEFIPVVVESDVVQIDCAHGLAEMMKSIKKGEAGDSQGQMACEAIAIRMLNAQLKNKVPENQTTVIHEPFNGLRFPQQCY